MTEPEIHTVPGMTDYTGRDIKLDEGEILDVFGFKNVCLAGNGHEISFLAQFNLDENESPITTRMTMSVPDFIASMILSEEGRTDSNKLTEQEENDLQRLGLGKEAIDACVKMAVEYNNLRSQE